MLWVSEFLVGRLGCLLLGLRTGQPAGHGSWVPLTFQGAFRDRKASQAELQLGFEKEWVKEIRKEGVPDVLAGCGRVAKG